MPVKQKFKHDPSNNIKGDCLRACVCSLLGISDDGVPNFVEDKDYPEQLYRFIRAKGYDIIHSKTEYPKNIYYMAWGISPRGVKHSVICRNGEFIHDPHPDGG